MKTSLQNKTILVTGASDGIGKQTALELAQMGARMLVHGRSIEKVKAACEEIAEISANDNLGVYVADFSSLQQVKMLAEQIIEKEKALHVLVNNAGVFLPQ